MGQINLMRLARTSDNRKKFPFPICFCRRASDWQRGEGDGLRSLGARIDLTFVVMGIAGVHLTAKFIYYIDIACDAPIGRHLRLWTEPERGMTQFGSGNGASACSAPTCDQIWTQIADFGSSDGLLIFSSIRNDKIYLHFQSTRSQWIFKNNY